MTPEPVVAPAALLEGHGEASSYIAATPDGACAVSTSVDKTARVWRDCQRRRGGGCGVASIRLERFVDWTRGVGVSADGRVVAVAQYGGCVSVRTVHGDEGDDGFRLERDGYEHANGVSMTPDGRWCVATFYKHNRLGGELVVMELGRRRDEGKVGMLSMTAWRSAAHLRDVAVSADGAVVALSCWNGGEKWYAAVVDARTVRSALVRGVTGAVAVPPLVERPAGRDDAAASDFAIPLAGPFPGIALSADGRRLAAADESALRVWSLGRVSGALVVCARYEASKNRSCAMTACGARVVASVAGGAFRVWDARSGVVLALLRGHGPRLTNPINRTETVAKGCAVSACGTRFWTCSTDKRVGYWTPPEHVLPRLEGRVVTDDDARAWFKAAAGYARRAPGLAYSSAGDALRALLQSAGHQALVRDVSGEAMDKVFELVDVEGRERVVESEFVSAVRLLLRRLGILERFELSRDWREKFKNAADGMDGWVSQRQATRLALKIAARERELLGFAPRSEEEDRDLVREMFARDEQPERTYSDSEGSTTRGPSRHVCVSGFVNVGRQLMRVSTVDTAWLSVDNFTSVPVRVGNTDEAAAENNGNGTSQLDQDCVICLEAFSITNTLTRLPCLHELHRDCLSSYLRSDSYGRREPRCPICRTNIPSQARHDVDVLPQRQLR